MTLRIEVAHEHVMTSRFAISPLWELTQALRSLARPPSRDDAALRPWLIRVRDRYQRLARDVDLAVLHALQPPDWGADFLSPCRPACPPPSTTYSTRSGPRRWRGPP